MYVCFTLTSEPFRHLTEELKELSGEQFMFLDQQTDNLTKQSSSSHGEGDRARVRRTREHGQNPRISGLAGPQPVLPTRQDQALQ